jgi:hypothetical protein
LKGLDVSNDLDDGPLETKTKNAIDEEGAEVIGKAARSV